MNKFVSSIHEGNRYTLTENGQQAVNTTNSPLLDLFGVIGALRSRSDDEITGLFEKAFKEDPLLAVKMSFYARNVRGGLGERHTAKVIWNWLANKHPEIVRKNLELIPFFGRFDDLYSLVGTEAEPFVWEFIKKQWDRDVQGFLNDGKISLMAKWLKSINTSSKESVRLGKLTAKHLHMSEPQYRHSLSSLRNYLNVVEKKMSSDNWGGIDYEGVPSKAMATYRNAFKKHDEFGFSLYMDEVKSGTKKINASTLYPYEILEKMGLTFGYQSYYSHDTNMSLNGWDEVLEEQWKALPNYVQGENNIIVMADTSGSMSGRPINTSIGLAIYFAERNQGAFANLFMTFSEEPSWVRLSGKTLEDKVACIPNIVANTDLEKAFDLVLSTALAGEVPAEDMPKALVIISDMEFDVCSDYSQWSFYRAMKRKFENNGYKIPEVIFWNVSSRQDVFHVESNWEGVQLASGQSTSVFKQIIDNLNGVTPYEAMVRVLSSEVYSNIKI